MVIIEGGPHEFGALAFGEVHPATLNFLESQAYNLSHALNDAGRRFMQRGQQIFEQFNGMEAIRRTKAALRSIQHAFQPDSIRYLDNIASMQQAPVAMQRWIMACPVVREHYHQNRCDGYSDTYVDMEPGSIGANHTDWQKVMNGLLLPHDVEGQEADWKCTTYFHTDEGDVRLTLTDQIDILSTWDAIKSMMGPGKEDPTSPYCDKM